MNSALKQTAILALLASASVLAVAQTPRTFRSVDVRTFDVAGVKTGMDFEEAMNAAMQHFQVARSQIRTETSPNIGPVTKAKLPTYFIYEKNGVKLSVYFDDRVPLDKGRPLAVSRVLYEIPWSQENSKAMMQAALSKYGLNSNAPNDLPMHWCAQPNVQQVGLCNGTPQAVLKLSQVELELQDPEWRRRRDDFVTSTQARKPSF